MSNLAKLEINALEISGKNYLTWASDAKWHLRSNGLLDTIDPSVTTSDPSVTTSDPSVTTSDWSKAKVDENKAKAMVFLRHHIHDSLKKEYITKKDPADLWQSLKDRFDHQRHVILPKARYDWLHLRFLDYKSVEEYNSALFGITATLELCGEKLSDFDMIEKTLSTFHGSNVVMQEQYRAKEYTRYSELMQVLLVAEQNNQLVMMNHQKRPPGSAPFPEVNVVAPRGNYDSQERGRQRGRGRGRGRGRARGRGRGRDRGCKQGRGSQPNNAENNNRNFQVNEAGRAIKKQTESSCFRCGRMGHWERTCRTPKYFVDMYQELQKAKGNNVETNFIQDEAGPSFNSLNDDTHLDIADFLIDTGDVN